MNLKMNSKEKVSELADQAPEVSHNKAHGEETLKQCLKLFS